MPEPKPDGCDDPGCTLTEAEHRDILLVNAMSDVLVKTMKDARVDPALMLAALQEAQHQITQELHPKWTEAMIAAKMIECWTVPIG